MTVKMCALIIITTSMIMFAPKSKAQVKWGMGVGRGWGFVFDKGETIYKPADTRLSLSVKVPFVSYAAMFIGCGLVIPDSSFKPAPRVTAGVGFRLMENLSLGVAMFYHLSPPYGEKSTMHTLGGGVSISVPINKTLSAFLATGPAKTIDGPWSFVVKPGISFVLPF